ncbi:MAG: hypothetical protein GX821_02065 [Clostridiaceae bacterium]|nr:hypothetical protein [Clostridiaceae bacterium]
MVDKDAFVALASQVGAKTAEQLRLPRFARLIDALVARGIEDDLIAGMLTEAITALKEYLAGDLSKKKAVQAICDNLTKHVREKYGLVEKGYYVGTYLAIGVAIGCGLGVALMAAQNSAYLAIGMGIGIALGAALGSAKEEQLKKDGKLY